MSKQITDIVSTIVTITLLVSPILYQLFKLLSQTVHNKALKNLLARAAIISGSIAGSVAATPDQLEKSKTELVDYAKEIGVKLTPEQAETYLKSADSDPTTVTALLSSEKQLQLLQQSIDNAAKK